ncbi:MAG: peptide deformylase [Pseudomonadota bacterium]
MTVRAIIEYPNPLLRRSSERVTRFDLDTQQLVQDLFDTLATTNAIGLSAPQLGELKRVLVVHVADDEYGARSYINPEIVERSGFGIVEESCLSVPNISGNVIRYPSLRVRAQDGSGAHFEEDIEGMHAVCLQHEIDHLDGKLFIDRLSWFKRFQFKRANRRRLAAALA